MSFQLSADVLGCNVYSDGGASAIDTWNPSSSKTNVLVYAQVGYNIAAVIRHW